MDRTVRFWTFIHSLSFLGLGVYLLSPKVTWGTLRVVPAAAGIGVCSFTVLFLLQGRSSISAPNGVSLLRLVLVALATTARVYYEQVQLVLVAGLLRYGYVFLLLFLPEVDEKSWRIEILQY
jgi:hypothetical protein